MSFPGTVVSGLAYDPAVPNRVYVSLRQGGVRISDDGGRTWVPRGRDDLGETTGLVLGANLIDLYAATRTGVWSLRLGV